MVARIRSGKSLKGAVNYNESKVKDGKADLIMAKGYSKDIGQLRFNDKLNCLQKLADLNTRASTHCLHVSLNFDVTENLSQEKLQQIECPTWKKSVSATSRSWFINIMTQHTSTYIL